jgi:hypothetical protein
MILSRKILEAFLQTLADAMGFELNAKDGEAWVLQFQGPKGSTDKIRIIVRLVRDNAGKPALVVIYSTHTVQLDNLSRADLLKLLELSRDLDFAKVALLNPNEGRIGVTTEIPAVDLSAEELALAISSVKAGTITLMNMLKDMGHRIGFRPQ